MKRLFALLLCLMMALSLIPAAAAEDIEIIDIPEETGEDPISIIDPEAVAPAPADEPMAGDVAINETNFPDSHFRSYLTRFDKDKDGVFSASEIAEVTYMTAVQWNISSLQGLKFFTALTYLDCRNNLLTELEIGITENQNLVYLDCSNNDYLTSVDNLQAKGEVKEPVK